MDDNLFYFMRRQSVNLLRYLPKFLAKDPTFKNLEDTLSWEHEQYRLKLVDIAKQFFLETATWGLADWEDFLGITPNSEQSFELRKAVARVKLRGAATMTLENTRRLMSEFMTEGEPFVEELGDFEIRVGLDNAVYSWAELFQALLTYLPAHLDFSIKFQDHRELEIYLGQCEIFAGEEFVENTCTYDESQNIFISATLQDVPHEEVLTDFSTIADNGNSLSIATIILDSSHEEFLAETIEPEYDWEFEKLLWERWRKWKHNPLVKQYAHHFDDDEEIEPDEPEETFPAGSFLRLYFKFPDTKRLRYLTLTEPREGIQGREINSLGVFSAANGIILNERRQPTTGIVKAFYVTKTTQKIL